jgi:hypothetical protein
MVKPVRHVCSSCGYGENWFGTPEDIARVKALYDGREARG